MAKVDDDDLSDVPPVHPGLALESMRNSSFDTFSAIGELVDNSIEANAHNIRIRADQQNVNEGKRGAPKIRTTRLVVGDDGYGMAPRTMHQCLQLGFSSRYNERQGIGRFGVGMTLGSINQCKRIDVYSRQEGGAWYYAFLDLKAVAEAGNNATLTRAVKKAPPKDLLQLVGESSGTLVIWSEIDRMHDNNLESLSDWLGRTYRKFLSPRVLKDKKGAPAPLVKNSNQVRIELNESDVAPFDPLYVLPAVKGDPPAELLETIFIDHPLDDDSLDPKSVGTSAKVSIRLSLLPKELRPRSGWGNSPDARARRIPDNVGFSILRNQREVYFGPWINIFDLGDANDGRLIDRYWSMEIEFPATLDNQFQVKNIKAGARPLAGLCDSIQKVISSTVVQYRKAIRAYWDEVEHAEKMAQPEAAAQHRAAEDIAKTVKFKAVPATPQQAKKIVEKLVPDIATEGGKKGEKEVADWLKRLEDGIKIVESINAHPSGPFIDISHLGAKIIVNYTMKHHFFRFVYQQIDRICEEASVDEDSDDDGSTPVVECAHALKAAIDLLLMAFAHAHSDALSADPEHAEVLLERLISQWSSTLSQFVRKMPESA